MLFHMFYRHLINQPTVVSSAYKLIFKYFNTYSPTMELSEIISNLNEMAPLSLAESWDNVGLLVEPSPPLVINKILLTNDLTEEVAEETFEHKAGLIISYHPPLFQPLKTVNQKSWKQRILVRCLESRVAIYSPHTCYDALYGGVNDWLGQAFESGSESPIQISKSSYQRYKVELEVTTGCVDAVVRLVDKFPNVHLLLFDTGHEKGICSIPIICGDNDLANLISSLKSQGFYNFIITKLDKPPLPGYGMGRLLQLKESIPISSAVSLVKKHLKLDYLRLALGSRKTLDSLVSSVALCAGSGSSVLKGIKSDIYLTGEMSHHDVLDAVSNGITVILCEHSNTERGFLTVLAGRIKSVLNNKVEIIISHKDRDPLCIV